MERGRLYWRLWSVQIVLSAIVCTMCWVPTLWLNVMPWWQGKHYGVAALATAAFAVLAGTPFAAPFLPKGWRIGAYLFSVWLFYMCFYGAAEMVVKARDDQATKLATAIKAGTRVVDDIGVLKGELDGVKQRLKEKGNPDPVSDGALDNLRIARDTARSNECGL